MRHILTGMRYLQRLAMLAISNFDLPVVIGNIIAVAKKKVSRCKNSILWGSWTP